VIVGAVLGIAFIGVMNRLTRGDPTIGFGIALALAVPAAAVVGNDGRAARTRGSIGGLLATRWLEALPALRSRLEGVVLTGLGGGFVALITSVESVVAAVEPCSSSSTRSSSPVLFSPRPPSADSRSARSSRGGRRSATGDRSFDRRALPMTIADAGPTFSAAMRVDYDRI